VRSQTIILQRIFVSERGDGERNESINFYYLLLLTVGSNSESVLKLISDIVTRILEMNRPIKWACKHKRRIKCGYAKNTSGIRTHDRSVRAVIAIRAS
jgi:hypothetical protein